MSQPHEQHDAVDRVGADRLLDVHAREVAEQHRGRPDAGLAERHHRELERHAARFPDAALDVLGELAEVAVARRQLRPGVADADDRPAVEDVVRQPAAEPAAMDESVLVRLAEPRGGSVFALLSDSKHSQSFSLSCQCDCTQWHESHTTLRTHERCTWPVALCTSNVGVAATSPDPRPPRQSVVPRPPRAGRSCHQRVGRAFRGPRDAAQQHRLAPAGSRSSSSCAPASRRTRGTAARSGAGVSCFS